MNANDIQTLTNEMCLFYGVPSGKGKLYYLKTSEGGFNIPLSSFNYTQKGNRVHIQKWGLVGNYSIRNSNGAGQIPKKNTFGQLPRVHML